jgi:hypothetical protein
MERAEESLSGSHRSASGCSPTFVAELGDERQRLVQIMAELR